MDDRRPSDRELDKRLNEAKEFLKNRHGAFANPSKAVGELNDLDIGDTNDIWPLIIPKVIQNLVFDKAGAQNFDQAKPAPKRPPIRNRGRFGRSKLWDAGAVKNQILNHLGYRELLEEITLKDYRGSRPPQKSYEKAIVGLELLAFSWWSAKCAKQMYIKFVLKNERYYYVSLHQSRWTEQKGED